MLWMPMVQLDERYSTEYAVSLSSLLLARERDCRSLSSVSVGEGSSIDWHRTGHILDGLMVGYLTLIHPSPREAKSDIIITIPTNEWSSNGQSPREGSISNYL